MGLGEGKIKIILPNSGDWPADIQPKIDAIALLSDSDFNTISEEDLLQAQKECASANIKDPVFQAICGPSEKSPADIWTVGRRLGALRGRLSPDNPINELIQMESELVGPAVAEEAGQILEEVVRRVKDRLIFRSGRSPQPKLMTVYEILEEMGIEFKAINDPLFTSTLKQKKLDCDTSSFVVAAVAHEFGWPVRVVSVPGHAFVRYDDGEIRFNIDQGAFFRDSHYIRKFKTVDFSGLDIKSGLRALFFANRGDARYQLGQYEEAIRDFDEAISLNPNLADVYNNRGVAKDDLGQYEEAIRDYDEAIRLDPGLAAARINHDIATRELGR